MNGELDRQNRDILKRLKIGASDKRDMSETLYEYLMMYNSTPHSVTGKTPSELFFRRMYKDKIPRLKDISETENDAEVVRPVAKRKKKGRWRS